MSPVKKIVDTVVGGASDLLLGEEIKPPKPAAPPPPPPPPPPTPGAAPFVASGKTQPGPVIGGQRDADLQSKAKGRSSLVIDLNIGGGSRATSGLNIPR